MRRKYIILILTCLSAGILRCPAVEGNGKVPADSNHQKTDGTPGPQGDPPQQAQGTSSDFDKSVKSNAEEDEGPLEKNSGAKPAVDTASVVSSEDSKVNGVNGNDRRPERRSAESVVKQDGSTEPPKAVLQEDATNKEADVKEKATNLRDDTDRIITQVPSKAGNEESVKENVIKTADTAKKDTQHFPDAVVPDVKDGPPEKLAEKRETPAALFDEIPGVIVPPAVTSAKSLNQPAKNTEAQDPALFQTHVATDEQPQDDAKQEADPSSELHFKANAEQSFVFGTGGMVVDESLNIGTPPKILEEEGVPVAEDIQTFGEWRKKVLEEELEKEKENEKTKQLAKDSSKGESQTVPVMNSQKLRVNYASDKCGAKIVAYNPEMENGNHMLTANRDQYMINPCSAKKWFVVELCEPVSVMMVELASLELFSSQPHTFRFYLYDRYPAKEWLMNGTFEMTPDKVPQPFPLKMNSPYVKFVRIEMVDYYGKEHFCPITLFRVFGLPMEDDDGDEDGVSHHAESDDDNENSQTLFARTKDTVVNLMKKVLYTDGGEEKEKDMDEAAVKEKHANATGNDSLPCDPEVENKSAQEKTIEGTPVTVHHPKPTVDSTQAETSSSAAPGDIPMVTKLDDEDQMESEDKSANAAAKDQDMVILLESGRPTGWERALHFCHPKTNKSSVSCSFNPVCSYVETFLGTPPPISRPKISLSESSSTSNVEKFDPSRTDFLEPSFTTTVSDVQNVKTVSSSGDKRTQQDEVYVQSSSEGARNGTSMSSEATTRIPSHFPTESVSSSASMISPEKKQEEKSEIHTVGEEKSTPKESPSTTETTASAPIPKEKPSPRTSGKMVETDPVEDTPSSTEVETEDLVTTRTTDSHATEDTEKSTRDKATVDIVSEILQPSILPDTTSVISSTLSRPTPVLEMEGASVSAGGPRGEVLETLMPSLSPSPTSEMPDEAMGQVDSAAYPQIVQPTIEDAEPYIQQSEAPEMPEEATISGESRDIPGQKQEEVPTVQNATETLVKQNDTEKKQIPKDLVHVPISLGAKRETAIMRLTNRIKALELNVSLSSRFLEELSSRFKKQNEEMMKVLNKTMSKLNTTATASHIQAMQQEKRIDQLETRLDNLTASVQILAEKFDTFAEHMSDRQMTFTTLNLLLVVLALYLFYRGSQSPPLHPEIKFLLDTMPSRPPQTSPFPRRNSDVTLSMHHDPRMSVATGMKKSGSVMNLGAASASPTLLFPEKTDIGPKKKKRKKQKTQKTESVGGTDSDPGFKMSSMDSISGSENGFAKLGHRRCGSATASFPASGGASALVVASAPQVKSDNKEVQFSLGGKTIPAKGPDIDYTLGSSSPLSLPYSLSSSGPCSAPSSKCDVITSKPPIPRSQRSKSLTSPPSSPLVDGGESDTFDGGGGVATGKTATTRIITTTYDYLPKPWDQSRHSGGYTTFDGTRHQRNFNGTASAQLPLLSKPKTHLSSSTPAVNGERESKSGDQNYVPQRKGSFRGGVRSEEGKLVGVREKGKGGKKPWKGHSFERA
ncbi:SUN domain-containing ossification factor-like [Littorina saxatilis]|uniref:SUN domain-containing protein n=1 Tax=Littorina saxatilis TaxID=31220 RepID=A0AAN9AXI8_9CAEN